MFVATQIKPEIMYNLFAAHFPLNSLFKPWQIITHMFMHGGPMHIAFNMYALWAFGTPLLHIWKDKKFLIFYFVSGLGAIGLFMLAQYYSFSQDVNALIAKYGGTQEQVIEVLNSGKYFSDFPDMIGIYNGVMLGASGAVYGLLVAFAFYFPNAELMLMFIPYPIKAKYFVPLMVAADFFFGITTVINTPIAHMAHVGGALTGFILMKSWQKFEHKRWN